MIKLQHGGMRRHADTTAGDLATLGSVLAIGAASPCIVCIRHSGRRRGVCASEQSLSVDVFVGPSPVSGQHLRWTARDGETLNTICTRLMQWLLVFAGAGIGAILGDLQVWAASWPF
jgi:hypothetical protein